MAITRAQQVRQMLKAGGGMLVSPSKDGKRPGYRFGDERDTRGFRERVDREVRENRRNEDKANLREQASVARTQGRTVPTMEEVREIVRKGEDDRGNPLQNRNQKNITEYNKNLKDIEENKDLNFVEKFNAKKRLKNKVFIDRKYSELAAGMAQKYGLSQTQLQDLLEAYGRDEDQVEFFGKMQDILDMDPSARNLGQDFNEGIMKGALGAIELSPRMKKGVPLSTAELFSTTDPTSRIELPGFLGKVQGDENFSNVISGLNRLQTLDEISQTPGGVKQSDIDNYFNLTMGKGGIDPLTNKPVDALFTPRDDDGGPSQVTDPCKGPNPPAYCFIGGNAPPSDDDQDPTGGMAFRFMSRGGSPMDAPTTGGIMDLETGRQMYFLGKLVKKASRALKKITKSPIGKAAILGGLAYFGGGGGNLFTAAGRGKFSLSNLFSLTKNPLISKDGGFSPMRAIGLASLSPFLFSSEQEEEDQTFNRGPGLDIDYIRNNPYTFIPRRFAAEGGDIEPVAKKTMPLLDMGGKEMDLREDGGFVPIGRMEKADDVPARLSKNEFVFTADAVRNAGDGDVDKGAEVMYNMMKNLESGGEVSEESQGLEGARAMFQTSKRLEEVL